MDWGVPEQGGGVGGSLKREGGGGVPEERVKGEGSVGP